MIRLIRPRCIAPGPDFLLAAPPADGNGCGAGNESGNCVKNLHDVRFVLTFVFVNRLFMPRTVTVTLGSHFEEFIRANIAGGRYNNVSEVIRAGLRRLEEDESRLAAIRVALKEGEESGIVENFDPDVFLRELNAGRENEIQSI